jgi:hypothetical protein
LSGQPIHHGRGRSLGVADDSKVHEKLDIPQNLGFGTLLDQLLERRSGGVFIAS